MKVCREFVFAGHVQGVGFRYTTRRIAALFEVTGYVKNLANGNVELVAEGADDEVQAFVDAVKHQMADYITDCRESNRKLQQFEDFEIRL